MKLKGIAVYLSFESDSKSVLIGHKRHAYINIYISPCSIAIHLLRSYNTGTPSSIYLNLTDSNSVK